VGAPLLALVVEGPALGLIPGFKEIELDPLLHGLDLEGATLNRA
jgi:hypothetical protein